MTDPKEKELDDISLDLFFEGIKRKYGYDFANYSRPTMERRVSEIVQKEGMDTALDLTKRCLQHTDFFRNKILNQLTITVTELFRDPDTYKAIIANVFPFLRSYARFSIWIAGSATGEEVFSMAILLKELPF